MSSELTDLLSRGHDVASVADLVGAGISRQVIAGRVRTGRWQRPLPRVIVAHSGPLTDDQRRRAALIYGGPEAMLSHESAAAISGLRVVEEFVHITVPHGSPKPNVAFVVVHQTRATSASRTFGGLRCVGVARTVIDVACGMTLLNDVRALVADSVQRGLTTVAALSLEAEEAPRHCPAFLRRALEEVAAGARSAGEAEFLALLRKAGLPVPELNVPMIVGGQRYDLDALWRECGVIVEIDGRAWHVKAAQWEQDLRRQNALHGAGFVVLRFPMGRLYRDPDGVIEELRAVLRARGCQLAA